jgi:anaerobic selenocysteine-containing dehydrogenase
MALSSPEAPVMTDTDYPFVFLPGRILHDPRRELTVEVSGQRNSVKREELLEINPSDAASLGIADGDWLEITSRNKTIKAKASLTDIVFTGTASATFLFADLATSLDSSEEPEPMSKVPTLDASAVKISKIKA